MKDKEMVQGLFQTAEDNFERDGYLAPVLFAWKSQEPPNIYLLQGEPRDILPALCEKLRDQGYDRFTCIVEAWVVRGETNWQDWVGRLKEHPGAQTCICLMFVSPEETYSAFSVYDETAAGWVRVHEEEVSPDFTIGGAIIQAMKGGTRDGNEKESGQPPQPSD